MVAMRLLAGITGRNSPTGPMRCPSPVVPCPPRHCWARPSRSPTTSRRDGVAVDATPTLETVVAVVGGLLAGAPVVPVPADAGPRSASTSCATRAPQLVLGGEAGTATGRRSTSPAARRPAVPRGPRRRGAHHVHVAAPPARRRASCSRARRVAADLDALAEAWAWTADDMLVHGLPLFHVHGLVLGVLGALRVGTPLVHTGRPQPERVRGRRRRRLYFGVPTVWSRVVRRPAGRAGAAPAPGCWCPAARRCRRRSSSGLNALTGHARSSGTG